VIINGEKTKRQGSKQLLFGSFQTGGMDTPRDVVVKLKTEGRHLADESQIFDIFKQSTLKEEMLKCFNVYGQAENPDYLVLEDFGSDLRSVYSHDYQVRSSVIVANILKAVSTLHQLGIVHGDLKPENILVSPQFVCKLCDFDSACRLGAAFPRTPQGELKFSFGWVSPEIFKAYDEERRSHSKNIVPAHFGMDIFSLGLIVDLLCHSSLPLRDRTVLPNPQSDTSDHSQLRKCLSNQNELNDRSYCLTHLHTYGDLVGTMLSINPKNRETCDFYLSALTEYSRTGFYRKTKKQQSDLDLLTDFQKNFTQFWDQHQSSLGSHSLQLNQIRSEILEKLETYHSTMNELNAKVEHLSSVTVTVIKQAWEEAKGEMKSHTSAEVLKVITTLDTRMSELENNVSSTFKGSLEATMKAEMNLCLVEIAKANTNNETTQRTLSNLVDQLSNQRDQLAEISNNIHETHLKLLTRSDDMILKLLTLETVMKNSFSVFNNSIGAAQTNGELKVICDEMRVQIEGKVLELFNKMENNLHSQGDTSNDRLIQITQQLDTITRLSNEASAENKNSNTNLQARQDQLREALTNIDQQLRGDVDQLDTKLLNLKAAIFESLDQRFQSHADSMTSEMDSAMENTVKRVVDGQQLDRRFDEVKALGERLNMKDVELKKMINQSIEHIQSVKTFQHLSAFSAHSHPLLFMLTEERVRAGAINHLVNAANEVIRKSFRIHFLCTVCGKMAPSGRHSLKEAGYWTRLKNSLSHVDHDQGGYPLALTHRWVTDLMEGMKWILRALQLAGKLSGLPLPHLSEMIEILPVPDQLRDMSDEILQDVVHISQRFYNVARNMAPAENREGREVVRESRDMDDDVIDDTNRGLSPEERKQLRKSQGTKQHASVTYSAMEIEQLRDYWVKNRPKVTLTDVKLVRQLLEQVNDPNVEHTGLRRCLRPLDGTCVWVCEGDERSLMCPKKDDSRSCFQLYQAEGRSSCIIDMEFE
jgi:serine/threonine protein kinase